MEQSPSDFLANPRRTSLVRIRVTHCLSGSSYHYTTVLLANCQPEYLL